MKLRAALLIACLSAILIATVDVSAQWDVTARLAAVKDRPAVAAFSLQDASGKVVKPSDFRGRPMVVNLWATACAGCLTELPTFVKLHRDYGDKGLAVLGISMDVFYSDLKNTQEAWPLVKPFVASHKMAYPILVDDGTVQKGFAVHALPATYLLDKNGLVAAAYIGVVSAADVEVNVKALLNEGR